MSECKDDGWNLLAKDTDCKWCHYTIRKSSKEGMFFQEGLPFCDETCHDEWEDLEKEG